MGYKKDDPCLKKAFDDERLFILMARDSTAPEVIMEWVKLNVNIQPKEKIDEAIACAREMGERYMEFYNRKEAGEQPKERYLVVHNDGRLFIEEGDEENTIPIIDMICDGEIQFIRLSDGKKLTGDGEWIDLPGVPPLMEENEGE